MIFEWLKRIFKKWLWALGFLPALLDYISAYIPQDNIPPQVIEYLSKGGNWAFSLALFTFLLVVSSYLVFSEEKKDSENQIKKLREQVSKLQNEIVGFHNSKPVIDLYFLGEDNEVHKELTVEVKRCRDKPDFDNFLTEYRSELLNKTFAQSDTKPQGLRGRGFFTSQKSKNVYEKEVADHIEDYRQYLEKIFAAQIADSVAAWIQPVIANNGRGPAEKTAFSIALPLTYQYPNENVYLIAEMIHDNEIESLEFELTPPEVPTLYSNPMELDIPLSALQSQGWSNLIEQASNTVGPKYSRDSDGSCLIEYEVKELIQYKPEKNLEPFLIWLEGIQQSTTWQIPVKIISASLQEPMIDNLVIHINVLDEQESG